jgi:hypothetical protein
MPKKTASARGGASRNRPKPQKSIQLVHPNAAVKENDRQQDESSVEEDTTLAAPTSKTIVASAATVSKTEVASTKKSEAGSATSQKAADDTSAANRGSAAARLAARRQAVLKPQAPRNASLVTAEHYAYVKRDLIYILILAIIMFSAIIILHFVPAIGG